MGRADLARHVDPDNEAQRRDSIKTNLLRVYFSSSGPGETIGAESEAEVAAAATAAAAAAAETEIDAEADAETRTEGTGVTAGPHARAAARAGGVARAGRLASGGTDEGSGIPTTATATAKKRGTIITDAGPMI